tara:strand:+ start:32 stop:667 length:636 start_codon:yes stop_codon:yes gene_type:complete
MDASKVEQGSDAWFAARTAKVSASRVSDVMAKTKSGYGAGRANYMSELLVDRLTGQKTQGFQSAAMTWGIETEERARAAYEFHYDQKVDQVGFIEHPTIPMFGASPDGLIGDDGGWEAKCPNTATHVSTLLTGKIPEKYILQMQVGMACTGRKWWDYVSFDDRLPPEHEMWVHRVERDDEKIAELEAEVVKFLGELDEMVSTLNKRIKNNV